MIRAPRFWYRPAGVMAGLLWPLTLLWRAGAWIKARRARPQRSALRVVCIGNITTGGTGKTPITAALAAAAAARGWRPVILTRGHGGSLTGPVEVTASMTAERTGDEPLLLARHAPVVIAADRAAGAAWIEARQLGDLIVMDDGMQNHALRKDATLAVFNGRVGIGNGMIVPAGPLRETLTGLQRAEAAAISGEDATGLAARIARAHPDLPIFTVARRLDADAVAAIAGRPVVAFAGIGDPHGFFAMLADAGVNLVERHALADHGTIDDPRLDALTARSQALGAVLVTTEKDAARLGARAAAVHTVGLEIDLPAALLDKLLPPR